MSEIEPTSHSRAYPLDHCYAELLFFPFPFVTEGTGEGISKVSLGSDNLWFCPMGWALLYLFIYLFIYLFLDVDSF